MDLQTGVLCVIFAIVSSVAIYLMSASPVKENSFEEAKAKRKKLMKQYFEETRQSTEKAKEKKSKKAKKAKEKNVYDGKNVNTPDVDSQTEDEKENFQGLNNVENLIQPMKEEEVTHDAPKEEVSVSTKQEAVPKDKAKDTVKSSSVKDTSKEVVAKTDRKDSKKTKLGVISNPKVEGNHKQGKGLKESTKLNTILDSNVVAVHKETATNVSKIDTFPSSKTDPIPIVKNNDHLITTEEDSSETKINKEDPIIKDTTVETISQPLVKEVQIKSMQPSLKTGKKKRNDVVLQQLRNEKDAVNISLLMPLLQKAELSRSEIQLLIDVLLNKQQQESSEWLLGRQDPLVKLKKQLAEKEQALLNEQQATIGLQTKLKELRTELNSEKAAVRSMEENVANKLSECTALSLKLKKVTEESQALGLKTQKLQQQLHEEHLLISQLKEDQALQPKLHITHEQQHHEIHALKGHVSQLAAQLQEQQGVNNDLVAENTVLQERVRMHDVYTADMKHHLSNAVTDAKRLQDQVEDNRNEIEKLSNVVQSLQSENQALQEKNDQLSKQMITACQEQRRLAEVNEALAAKESKENGDVGYSHKQDDSELRTILEEKESSLAKLHSDLQEKESQIEKFKNDIVVCKNEANKKQTILDNASSEVSKLRSQTTDLVAELAEKKKKILQLVNDVSEKTEEMVSLKKEVEMHKQRNNELRNKNWKVVEALTIAEKALLNSNVKENDSTCDKSDQLTTPELKLQITQLFQRIFPDISIDGSKDTEIWLKKLESAVLEEKCSSTVNKTVESDLEAQNRHLQAMLAHYKTIINETEGILKSLQSHIEVEETRWGEKLQAQQAEIDILRSQQLKGKCSDNEFQFTAENGNQEIQ